MLASGALGRWLGEVGVGEQRFEHLAERLAAPGARAVPIEPRVGVEPASDGVDHRYPRPGVEREGAVGRAPARHPSDVRDPTDVEQ